MKGISKLNKTALKLLMMLWQMPYACAEDLKSWPLVSPGPVYRNLANLKARGLVGSESLGWMRNAQRRYFLREAGVALVMQRTGWPIHWAVTARGRNAIRSSGPMLECLYHAAPRFWRPPWVLEDTIRHEDEGYWGAPDYFDPEDCAELEPEVNPKPTPDSFTWLRQGPLHALVGMQQGQNAGRFWVPLIWHGAYSSKNRLPDWRNELLAHLETEPDPVSGLPAFAPGVVIVAQDFLAARVFARENPRKFTRLILAYETPADNGRRFGVSAVELPLEIELPHEYGRVVNANPSLSM